MTERRKVRRIIDNIEGKYAKLKPARLRGDGPKQIANVGESRSRVTSIIRLS